MTVWRDSRPKKKRSTFQTVPQPFQLYPAFCSVRQKHITVRQHLSWENLSHMTEQENLMSCTSTIISLCIISIGLQWQRLSLDSPRPSSSFIPPENCWRAKDLKAKLIYSRTNGMAGVWSTHMITKWLEQNKVYLDVREKLAHRVESVWKVDFQSKPPQHLCPTWHPCTLLLHHNNPPPNWKVRNGSNKQEGENKKDWENKNWKSCYPSKWHQCCCTDKGAKACQTQGTRPIQWLRGDLTATHPNL